jgi:hypothetical protein
MLPSSRLPQRNYSADSLELAEVESHKQFTENNCICYGKSPGGGGNYTEENFVGLPCVRDVDDDDNDDTVELADDDSFTRYEFADIDAVLNQNDGIGDDSCDARQSISDSDVASEVSGDSLEEHCRFKC